MQLIARERLVQEIENRMWAIAIIAGYPLTVADVQRNPSRVNELFPCVNIFEDVDRVTDRTQRGGQPQHRRQLDLAIEFWLIPTDERLGSKEIIEFYQSVRWALFKDGDTLGLSGTQLLEVETSEVLKPAKKGDLLIGMGVKFLAVFVDAMVDPTQP